MAFQKIGDSKNNVEINLRVGIGIRVDLHAAPSGAYRFGRCGSCKHVAPMALMPR